MVPVHASEAKCHRCWSRKGGGMYEGHLCPPQLHQDVQQNHIPAFSPTREEDSAALPDAPRTRSNNAAREAIHCREKFSTYLNTEGAVPWQRHVM